MIPLLNNVAKVKESLDDTLEISGAVVVPDDDTEASHLGWGEEDVNAVFKPLLVLPRVNLKFDLDELDLIDIPDLNPKIKMKIYKFHTLSHSEFFFPFLPQSSCEIDFQYLKNY